MNVFRHQQQSIYESMCRNLIPDHENLLWEPWLREVDALLEDEELIDLVHQALGRRRKQSSTRGRKSTPSEVVLRLMVLKHLRNWSYEVLEREVRANLVYRRFTRIGMEKVPDAKSILRLANTIGPETIRKIHERIQELGQKEKVARGKKMRVDTTVVETNIHYPTDSSLMGDAARVITRTIKKIQKEVGQAVGTFRNRMRSVTRRVIEIARTARSRTAQGRNRMRTLYEKLIGTTRTVVREAANIVRRAKEEIATIGDPIRRAIAEQLVSETEQMSDLADRVVAQAEARVIHGDTHFEDKIVSVFEPETEIIRKGKASKPTEFGKMIKIQEAENQLITDYQVYEERPADTELLLPAIEKHREQFGHVPRLVAADAGFYSAENEKGAIEAGVEKVSIPNRRTRSPARVQHQRERWFKRGQRWRVGCEGRISVVKRRHGLTRCRYKRPRGMERWVGLGVIANNLIVIGNHRAKKKK